MTLKIEVVWVILFGDLISDLGINTGLLGWRIRVVSSRFDAGVYGLIDLILACGGATVVMYLIYWCGSFDGWVAWL